jgi:hypothetical protein
MTKKGRPAIKMNEINFWAGKGINKNLIAEN